MANVAHATLTGSNLHEPKGITTATNGQVYVANGAGTGVWTDISATSFVGQVADFATPVAPTGWLEADGTDISKVTFPALFAAMTIQNTATRGSGSPIVTLTTGNTNNMRPGYFVYGLVAGQFVSGTTILTVDSGIQFTMSAGASSGGTATVVVSPWLLNTNTIRLPNVSAAAKYRRSRSSTLHMGVAQADTVKTHTHSVSGATGAGSPHAHGGTVDSHGHPFGWDISLFQGGGVGQAVTNLGPTGSGGSTATGNTSPGLTTTAESSHSHSLTGTAAAPGGADAENRPTTLVLMTCVKT